MRAKSTAVFLLLLQNIWLLSLGQTIIVSKGINNAHPKLSSKYSLEQPSLPDILEKKEPLFPEVYYPESILDFNHPMYYNQQAFDMTQSVSNKDSGDIPIKTAAPVFGNYKRKQRLRALNDLYKKVNNSIVNDLTFDDERKENHNGTDKKGMRLDQLYINKILAKKPYANTLVKDKTGTKTFVANTKDNLKNNFGLHSQTKANHTVVNEKPVMDSQIQLIVADLIDITEEIFDSVLAYISDNSTINNLSGDEIVEILQVVENLNKVLEILEYLSTNFITCKVQNDIDGKNVICESLSTSPAAETQLNATNQNNNSTNLSLTEVVDEAILKVDSILNNTFPSLDNCSGEISKATYEMVNSLKQILVVMEELNTNVSSSSIEFSKMINISSTDAKDTSADGNISSIFDQQEAEPEVYQEQKNYGNETSIDGKISSKFDQQKTDPEMNTESQHATTESNSNSSLYITESTEKYVEKIV